MFKVGDRVKHNSSLFSVNPYLGTIIEVKNGIYGIKWDQGSANYGYIESEISYLVSVKLTENKTIISKSVCNCDSRQLFNFGHNKTCPEKS